MYVLIIEEVLVVGLFFFSQQLFSPNTRKSREMYNANEIDIIAYNTNIIIYKMKIQVHSAAVQFVSYK